MTQTKIFTYVLNSMQLMKNNNKYLYICTSCFNQCRYLGLNSPLNINACKENEINCCNASCGFVDIDGLPLFHWIWNEVSLCSIFAFSLISWKIVNYMSFYLHAWLWLWHVYDLSQIIFFVLFFPIHGSTRAWHPASGDTYHFCFLPKIERLNVNIEVQ